MKKLPKIISQEEFEQLFSAVQKLEKKAGSKRRIRLREYRLAMLLGFEAGLRISEIVGLEDRVPPLIPSKVEVSSIRVESGKGKKDRIVPRPKRFNENAKGMMPLKIQRRALQHFITKLGKDVLDKDITFHTLRHGFATMLLEKGFQLHEVQMFMGHSRLDTTGIYLHASPTRALDKYKEVF